MKFNQDLCLNLRYDFGMMNSTLGFVVPLAMFYLRSDMDLAMPTPGHLLIDGTDTMFSNKSNNTLKKQLKLKFMPSFQRNPITDGENAFTHSDKPGKDEKHLGLHSCQLSVLITVRRCIR